jgi:hypothetical protein
VNLERVLVESIADHVDAATYTQPELAAIRVAARRRVRRRAGVIGVVLTLLAGGTAAGALGTLDSTRSAQPVTTEEPAPRLDALDYSADDVALEAGSYTASVLGAARGPLAVIKVPDAWHAGAAHYVAGDRIDSDTLVAFYSVDRINVDPCYDTRFVDPGPGVRQLAEALGGQRFFRGDGPEPAVLAGYDGYVLEQVVPTELPAAGCANEHGPALRAADAWLFDRFVVDGERVNNYLGGQTHRVWVLDVAGRRVVVEAVWGTTDRRADIEQVLDIVASIRFTNTP